MLRHISLESGSPRKKARLRNVVLWLRSKVTEHIFCHGVGLDKTVDLGVLWVSVAAREADLVSDLGSRSMFAEVQA